MRGERGAAGARGPVLTSSHLDRLHAAAIAHAAALGDDGAGWLLDHGLLAVAGHADLPAALRPPLADRVRRNAARNLLLVHRFRKLAAALAEAGVPVAPLKGLRLLATTYASDPENRVLADLDLLIPAARAEAAVARLADLGYRETDASRRAARRRHERVLGDGELTVELHTSLAAGLGRRGGWEALAPTPGRLHDCDCHLLDDSTHLAHLCLHFTRHGPFSELRWAEDLLREAAAADDAGERLLDGAARLGTKRATVAAVEALRALVGRDLLPAVPRRLGGLAGTALAITFAGPWRGMRRRPFAAGAAIGPWRRTAASVLLADRPADALRAIAGKLTEIAARS
ncbi:MAG TPA: nucleotidyltransferase family protein [Thermoanaerobaculia bacterium]|nr:nucleotidyltransferase family protein [Thermoanaerobaculia bacterium]